MTAYFGTYIGNADHELPDETRSLMIGMLREAHYDLRKSPDRREYRSAKSWIEAEGEEYLFSFWNVCYFLGLNQEETKQRLHEGKRYVYDGNRLARIKEPRRKNIVSVINDLLQEKD